MCAEIETTSFQKGKAASYSMCVFINAFIYVAYDFLVFYYYEVELGLAAAYVGISFVIFAILMVLAIGGMIAVMSFRGFDADLSLTIIFALIAIVSGVVFIAFTKHLKKLKG